MLEKTIFAKILDKEVPCNCVYEDEHLLAFLDVAPLSHGHTIVIPKERVAMLHELSDEAAAAIGRALPRICWGVMQVTGCSSYNILQNNGAAAHQAVFHVHFHIIPRFDDAGLGIEWNVVISQSAGSEPLAAEIKAVIEQKA